MLQSVPCLSDAPPKTISLRDNPLTSQTPSCWISANGLKDLGKKLCFSSDCEKSLKSVIEETTSGNVHCCESLNISMKIITHDVESTTGTSVTKEHSGQKTRKETKAKQNIKDHVKEKIKKEAESKAKSKAITIEQLRNIINILLLLASILYLMKCNCN